MVCFSGIGGIISVGCSLVRASLREANSEYRRRTISSYRQMLVMPMLPAKLEPKLTPVLMV